MNALQPVDKIIDDHHYFFSPAGFLCCPDEINRESAYFRFSRSQVDRQGDESLPQCYPFHSKPLYISSTSEARSKEQSAWPKDIRYYHAQLLFRGYPSHANVLRTVRQKLRNVDRLSGNVGEMHVTVREGMERMQRLWSRRVVDFERLNASTVVGDVEQREQESNLPEEVGHETMLEDASTTAVVRIKALLQQNRSVRQTPIPVAACVFAATCCSQAEDEQRVSGKWMPSGSRDTTKSSEPSKENPRVAYLRVNTKRSRCDRKPIVTPDQFTEDQLHSLAISRSKDPVVQDSSSQQQSALEVLPSDLTLNETNTSLIGTASGTRLNIPNRRDGTYKTEHSQRNETRAMINRSARPKRLFKTTASCPDSKRHTLQEHSIDKGPRRKKSAPACGIERLSLCRNGEISTTDDCFQEACTSRSRPGPNHTLSTDLIPCRQICPPPPVLAPTSDFSARRCVNSEACRTSVQETSDTRPPHSPRHDSPYVSMNQRHSIHISKSSEHDESGMAVSRNKKSAAGQSRATARVEKSVKKQGKQEEQRRREVEEIIRRCLGWNNDLLNAGRAELSEKGLICQGTGSDWDKVQNKPSERWLRHLLEDKCKDSLCCS